MQSRKPKSLKEALISKLPKEAYEKVNRSFEIVGNIAICEIPEDLIEFENIIAESLLEVNTSITTVLKKASNHEGVFRTQNMEVIGGINTKVTRYKENGIELELDVEKVYFSAKLSTERENLSKNTKNNSNQLVLFSGAGPYTYVITKQNPNIGQITSIEMNPEGHKYAVENLNLNKNNLKRSQKFQEFKKIIKEYNIPLYDKFIIENLNTLTYQFYNIDANLFNPKLKTIETKQKFDDEIFLKEPKELFEFLKFMKEESNFNIKKLSNKNVLKNIQLSLLLFPKKFSYTITKENKTYSFETLHEKNYLFNYLNDSNQDIETLHKYDEIYMPLPKTANEFLDIAFNNSRENCIVHMYDFMRADEFPQKSEEFIINYAKEHNYKIEILQTRKVGQSSPRKFRTCCDFKILKKNSLN